MAVTTATTGSEARYAVVVNDEDQYSIWPVGRVLPTGWLATGETGDKAYCLSRIEEVWTDMRPRSVRTAAVGDPTHGA